MSTQTSLTDNGDHLKALVGVCLLGGADGLNMVAPQSNEAPVPFVCQLAIPKLLAVA
jgi:uncharacterized protein (DUF1501 family)